MFVCMCMYILTSILMKADMHEYVVMYINMYLGRKVDMHKSIDVAVCA